VRTSLLVHKLRIFCVALDETKVVSGMDDIFSDLVKNRQNKLDEQGEQDGTHPGQKLPAISTGRGGSGAGQGAGGAPPPSSVTVALTRAELEGLVREVVADAFEDTLAKFAKSLRTVLEDLGRRIDSAGGASRDAVAMPGCQRAQQMPCKIRSACDLWAVLWNSFAAWIIPVHSLSCGSPAPFEIHGVMQRPQSLTAILVPPQP